MQGFMLLCSEKLMLQNKVESLLSSLLQTLSICAFRGSWVLLWSPKKGSFRGDRRLHTIQICLFTGGKNGVRKGARPAVDRVLFGDHALLSSNPCSITYYLASYLLVSGLQFSPL